MLARGTLATRDADHALMLGRDAENAHDAESGDDHARRNDDEDDYIAGT